MNKFNFLYFIIVIIIALNITVIDCHDGKEITYGEQIFITNQNNSSLSSNSNSNLTSETSFLNNIPTGKIVSPSSNECVPSIPIFVYGTASDDKGIDYISVMLDNSSITTLGTTNWVSTVTSLTIGFHSIQLIVYDKEGSTSAPDVITFTHGGIIPSILVYSPSNNQTYDFSSASLNCSGFYVDNPCCNQRTIQYKIDSNNWNEVTYDSGAVAGLWSNASISASSIGCGDHIVSFQIIDNCNLVSAITTRTITVNGCVKRINKSLE